MKFNPVKSYNVTNAKMLQKGTMVYYADSISELKRVVENNDGAASFIGVQNGYINIVVKNSLTELPRVCLFVYPVEDSLINTENLAEVLNTSKQVIANTVKKLDKELCPVVKNSQGGYLFNEKQATLIKQEIQKHHNLKSRQVDNVNTEYEMELMTQQVLQYHIQKCANLEQELEIQKPMVETYKKFLDTGKYIDVSLLGIASHVGRSKIFLEMKEAGYIYEKHDKQTNERYYTPCSRYLKYFHLTPCVIDIKGERKSSFKLQLTPEGYCFFMDKFSK